MCMNIDKANFIVMGTPTRDFEFNVFDRWKELGHFTWLLG